MSPEKKSGNSTERGARQQPKDSHPRKKHSCIVIGAGLAGLAAAHRLSKNGWLVNVLEVRGRPGGRVLSYRFPQAKEPGMRTWVASGSEKTTRQCGDFANNLNSSCKTTRTPFDSGDRKQRRKSKTYSPGEWGFSRRLEVTFEKFRDEYKFYTSEQQRDLDAYDWWTVLLNRGFPEKDLRNRDLMDSTDFGESIRHTSAFSAATEYFDGNETNEMDLKIIGGNDRLVYALVRSLGRGSVHYQTFVRKIRQRKSEVEVFVAGHAKPFIGDACICTVPIRSLSKIEWDPPLPVKQSEAAKQLQYCRITKTVVLYQERFWPKPKKGGFSIFTGAVSDFCFDSTYLQPGRQGILCSYAIGDKASDVAPEPKDQLKHWITADVVAAALGRHAPDSVIARYLKGSKIKRYAWQRDRQTLGAYAFYRPGQWFTVRNVLQESHGRVLFAGEHLADLQGFMEGAVNTGEAAANSL